MRRTYRQDPETGKFYEVVKASSTRLPVTDEISPFVSPVDGSVIRTKKQLEAHNRRHGVSNDLDSLREQARKARERQNAPLPQKERINDLVRSYDFVQQNPHLFRR